MIVGLSGRVSFKDESGAEILAEDIVPIDNIAKLSANNRNAYDRPLPGAEQHNRRESYQRPHGESIPVNDPVKLRVTEAVLAAHGGEARKVLMHITDMIGLCPGERDVLVYLPGRKPVRCSRDKRITMTDDLRSKLIRVLGEENVKI